MRGLLLLSIPLLLTGCGPHSPGDPDRDMVVEPIQIDSVTVQISESLPVQVSAHIKGVIGDGCATLALETQSRSGNTITIRIERQRPRNAICTQIAKLYDKTMPLVGSFPPGTYTLQVNSVVRTFRID